ncbi:hypothetical protein [Kingella denitrificans]
MQAALVGAGHALGQPEARVQAALWKIVSGLPPNLCRFPLAVRAGKP